jgi:nicotinate-nucleotide--dimethylbenzimidazole phosphoribosyltransferase
MPGLLKTTVARIRPAHDPVTAAAIRSHLDSLAKPVGSLGRLEEMCEQYGSIRRTSRLVVDRKRLFVFCGDHGVAAERVSAYPSAITAAMLRTFLSGGAAINVLCRHYGIDVIVVDVGVNCEPAAGSVVRKIALGTRNITLEPAMSRAQAEAAIEVGISLAFDYASSTDIYGAGEMGIANSTIAAALVSAYCGLDPGQTVGRGTGIDDATLARKTDVVRTSLSVHSPDPADPIGVLSSIGGFEIGATAGLILGAAAQRRLVVLDGYISCCGALIANSIEPASLGYVVFSHLSAERGHSALLRYLGAEPVLRLELRLGEGTGAALVIGLFEAAVRLYREMHTIDGVLGRGQER